MPVTGGEALSLSGLDGRGERLKDYQKRTAEELI